MTPSFFSWRKVDAPLYVKKWWPRGWRDTLSEKHVLWMSPYMNATLFVNGPLRKCVTKNSVSQDILLIYRGLTRHETIHTNTLARNVILFPKIFWPSRRKKYSRDREKRFVGHKINLFEQWKVRTIFETECFFNFFLQVSEHL